MDKLGLQTVFDKPKMGYLHESAAISWIRRDVVSDQDHDRNAQAFAAQLAAILSPEPLQPSGTVETVPAHDARIPAATRAPESRIVRDSDTPMMMRPAQQAFVELMGRALGGAR